MNPFGDPDPKATKTSQKKPVRKGRKPAKNNPFAAEGDGDDSDAFLAASLDALGSANPFAEAETGSNEGGGGTNPFAPEQAAKPKPKTKAVSSVKARAQALALKASNPFDDEPAAADAKPKRKKASTKSTKAATNPFAQGDPPKPAARSTTKSQSKKKTGSRKKSKKAVRKKREATQDSQPRTKAENSFDSSVDPASRLGSKSFETEEELPGTQHDVRMALTVSGYAIAREGKGRQFAQYVVQVTISPADVRDTENAVTWIIKRRFSKFLALHDMLSKEVTKKGLPAIPGKSLTRSLDTTTLMRKKEELNIYVRALTQKHCQAACMLPWLVDTPAPTLGPLLHKLVMLRAELQQSEAKTQTAQSKAQEAQQKLDELEAGMVQREIQLDKQTSTVEQMRLQMEDLQKKLQALSKENSALRSQNDQLVQQNLSSPSSPPSPPSSSSSSSSPPSSLFSSPPSTVALGGGDGVDEDQQMAQQQAAIKSVLAAATRAMVLGQTDKGHGPQGGWLCAKCHTMVGNKERQCSACGEFKEFDFDVELSLTGFRKVQWGNANPHIEYGICVTVGTMDWYISRRFSHFERIYKELVATFDKDTVPSLPITTHFERSFDSGFIGARKEGLRQWIEAMNRKTLFMHKGPLLAWLVPESFDELCGGITRRHLSLQTQCQRLGQAVQLMQAHSKDQSARVQRGLQQRGQSQGEVDKLRLAYSSLQLTAKESEKKQATLQKVVLQVQDKYSQARGLIGKAEEKYKLVLRELVVAQQGKKKLEEELARVRQKAHQSSTEQTKAKPVDKQAEAQAEFEAELRLEFNATQAALKVDKEQSKAKADPSQEDLDAV